MQDSIEQLLLFQRLPGVAAATYWQVLERYGSLSAAFAASTKDLLQILPKAACSQLREYDKLASKSELGKKLQADLAAIDSQRVNLISHFSEHYPKLLQQIARPPPLLYVRGDPRCLYLPQLAIIGSRNPTPVGRSNAHEFAAALSRCGFAITSGLALGVDIAAHQGCLSASGKTLAVLGTGIDSIYPKRHKAIAEEIIAAGGALVSEFPLGTAPQAKHFPQRNRIISGLSLGVLVVEAAVKSGSLITASLAVQQNREVFALPGSIHNPMSRGCHALIKQGAKLVETAKDVVEELQGFVALKWEEAAALEAKCIERTMSLSREELCLLEYLGYEITTIDELVERSGWLPQQIMNHLLTMELKGLVANTDRGYMRTGL